MTDPSGAAQLAPHVDRLVVMVHHRMRTRRRDVAATLARCGVRSPALLIDLRPFLVERQVIPAAVIDGFTRFLPVDATADTLRSLLSDGVLRAVAQGYAGTDAAWCFAASATAMQAEEVGRAWADASVAVAAAGELCDAVIAATPQDPSLALFDALRGLGLPAHAGAYRLHHRLTLLRYLRTDLHAAVLARHGLAPHQAVAVDAAWRGNAGGGGCVDDPGLASWFDPDGSLSTWGRTQRELVEGATNRRMDEILAGVDGAHELPVTLARIPS